MERRKKKLEKERPRGRRKELLAYLPEREFGLLMKCHFPSISRETRGPGSEGSAPGLPRRESGAWEAPPTWTPRSEPPAPDRLKIRGESAGRSQGLRAHASCGGARREEVLT